MTDRTGFAVAVGALAIGALIGYTLAQTLMERAPVTVLLTADWQCTAYQWTRSADGNYPRCTEYRSVP